MSKKEPGVKQPRVKAGRPQKLNAEVQEKIIAAVKAGAFIETAAISAGICRATFQIWLRKGEAQKKGIYRDFFDAVNEAFAEVSIKDIGLIGLAAERDWRAAAYRLEKRMPKEYSDRSKIESSEPETPQKIQIVFAKSKDGKLVEEDHLTDEDLDEIRDEDSLWK